MSLIRALAQPWKVLALFSGQRIEKQGLSLDQPLAHLMKGFNFKDKTKGGGVGLMMGRNMH